METPTVVKALYVEKDVRHRLTVRGISLATQAMDSIKLSSNQTPPQLRRRFA
jgi:hypothetical protein